MSSVPGCLHLPAQFRAHGFVVRNTFVCEVRRTQPKRRASSAPPQLQHEVEYAKRDEMRTPSHLAQVLGVGDDRQPVGDMPRVVTELVSSSTGPQRTILAQQLYQNANAGRTLQHMCDAHVRGSFFLQPHTEPFPGGDSKYFRVVPSSAHFQNPDIGRIKFESHVESEGFPCIAPYVLDTSRAMSTGLFEKREN